MVEPLATRAPYVGLFITCAVDLLRPSIARACVRLLTSANCEIVVPPQSCCGQVGYNNGLQEDTAKLARSVIATFSNVDYIVVPSGSCASMLKNHYPTLFSDTTERAKAQEFASRVFELTTFLHDVLDAVPPKVIPCNKKVAYHDSCAGLRELGIEGQPRNLAHRFRNANLVAIPEGQTCCGFGGTFCVKFPEISSHMVDQKIDHIRSTQADLLVGGDLSCLLNIAGRLERRGDPSVKVMHIAEFLVGEDESLEAGKH
jgi:Fe-S oxidoreductase